MAKAFSEILKAVAALAFLLLPLSPAGTAGQGDSRESAIRRIERAYRLGALRSASSAECLEALRIRAGALDALVDVSYQAALAWLAERGDLLVDVMGDQERWLEERELLSARAEDEDAPAGERMAALDRSSEQALARLRAFAALTAGTGR